MKKNEYTAPRMEVLEMEPLQVLSASADDIPVGGDGQGGGEALSTERRGTWGNLWDTDK